MVLPDKSYNQASNQKCINYFKVIFVHVLSVIFK